MKKYFLIIYLFTFNYLHADILEKLIIEGNNRFSVETIKVYGDIELKSDYSKNDTNKIIKNLYETNFFENISLTFVNGLMKITLKEYDSINTITIDGEKANKIKDKILERLYSQEKNSYIKSNLKKDVNMIKNAYGTLGFNFVDVEVKIEKLSDNRVNLIFFVEKGEKTKISKIYFIGDKKIRNKRLRDVIVSEEDKFWKILSKNTNLNKSNTDLDKRLLTNYYKSLGYYDVQVLSSSAEIDKNNETSITFNINAGPRYRIKKITTDITNNVDKKIFLPLNREFKRVAGKYYSPFTVKKMLEKVDFLIAKNDLQFIEHSVSEEIYQGSISIKINIFEGSKESVERINIKGNTVTQESVIRSELLLDEGDPFNNLKLEQSIAKLKARNIFGEVKQTVADGSSKNLKIIDIEVEEKPTGEISAGAGVGTNGGSFAFNIKENNWMGKGMTIASFLDLDKDSIKGQLSLRDPNYNMSGNELNYNISSIQTDKTEESGYKNTITSLGIGTRFEQYQDIFIAPSLNYSHDSLTVDDTASTNLQKQEGSFSDLALSYSIQQDKRDKAYMPTDGFYSSFSQTIPVYADAPYLRNSYRFSKYNSFGKDLVGAFKIYGSAINGLNDEDVRLSKRNFLSSNNLRGFKNGKVGPKDGQDFVGGNYAASMNFEAQLPNLLPESTKTDIGLFIDFANLWGIDYDSTLDDSNKIRSSAGAAVSWLSPVGPMSFVLSQNITKASTDETESFNFRLGTTF